MPQYLDSHNEFTDKPPGPMGGMWSVRYLDLFKTAKLMLSSGRKLAQKNFPKVLPPGADFPEMKLETADGRSINTADYRDRKHFVLMTGAIT